MQDEHFKMTGGPALTVLGVGENTLEAEQQVEMAIESVKGPVFHRPDIGTDELIQKKGQLI